MVNDMLPMIEEEFRTRFRLAFSIKPDLTSAEFYDILKGNGFDEKSSVCQVLKLAYTVSMDSDGSEEDSDAFSEDFIGSTKNEGSSNRRLRQISRTKPLKKAENEQNGTTVTRWISQLAGGLFVRTLLVCDGRNAISNKGGMKATADAENMTVEALIDITSDPEAVRRAGWTGRDETVHVDLIGLPLWEDKKRGRSGYGSAVVDGVVIKPGDFVTVRPGSDDHGPCPTHEKNGASTVAASIWFAHIAYIFKGEEGPCAHMHWLSHGGDTILGETAGARELFVLYRCDDAPLGSIAGKVIVDFVGQNHAKGQDGLGAVELSYHEVNHYFYRLAYSEVEDRFEQIQDLELLSRVQKQYCNCCEMLENEETSRSTAILNTSKINGKVEAIMHRGVTYGLHDFVYLTPKNLLEPYTIAQITEIKSSGLHQWVKSSRSRSGNDLKITLQVFNRYDDLLETYLQEFERRSGHSQRDCRRLYRDSARVLTLSLDRLDGKCIVRHLDTIADLNKFKDLEDTFYFADHIPNTMKEALNHRRSLAELKPLSSQELRLSIRSEENLMVEMSRVDAFMFKGRKLRAMEVFSGAGGLAVGLDQSGAIATKWAIELDTPASRTFQRNFPSAKVYNQDANVLLSQAIEEHLGISKGAIIDLSGNPLPRMPWPGEVDLLYGGPPCQDFSKCNQYQKANSIKNSLLATYLSYVDHYQPKYFLLENVQDLLKHRLGSSQVNIHTTKGGIEMGSTKFIIRALTSLGYQVQFSVLQAAEHGTPQSRLRVFFWGSKPGYPLPKYPEPTHVFSGRTPKPTRRTRKSAPHHPITVGDAISDLPAFDWKMDMPSESVTNRAIRARRSERISQVPLLEGVHVKLGADAQKYASHLALSEYQRELRGSSRVSFVQNHYTCRWNAETMVRIMSIPMRPGANHLDIPAEEDMWCLRSEKSAASKHRNYPDRYRRLDYNKTFQTCLCKIDPSGKNGSVLHPTQHRVLTVREQARAQGFPDRFTWDHQTQTPKDMYKQIGNAVPIPVGRALGRELLKVLVKKWETDMAPKGPDDVMDSIEIDVEGDVGVLHARHKYESDREGSVLGLPRRARRAAVTSEERDEERKQIT